MAEIFNHIVSKFFVDRVTLRTKSPDLRKKRRFLVVPKQIIEPCVNELRSREGLLVINLDVDPLSTVKNILNEENFLKFSEFILKSPCFRFVFLRKYIKYAILTLDEKNVKRIVFITCDVSLFSSLKYSSPKTIFAYANSPFVSELDSTQKQEIKGYNDSVEKEKKKLKFDNVKSFDQDYEKEIM